MQKKYLLLYSVVVVLNISQCMPVSGVTNSSTSNNLYYVLMLCSVPLIMYCATTPDYNWNK